MEAFMSCGGDTVAPEAQAPADLSAVETSFGSSSGTLSGSRRSHFWFSAGA
jgi:hypothetical protein